MRILSLLLALMLAAPAAWADAPTSLHAEPPSCTRPTPLSMEVRPPLTVAVNPATRWQPRGGTVLVTISAPPGRLKAFDLHVCFGWSDAPPESYFEPANLEKTFKQRAFVAILPSTQEGVVNIAVTVPDLDNAPHNFWTRLGSNDHFSGLGAVPVADMRVIGYSDGEVVFDVVREVGVTNVEFSLAFTIFVLGAAIMVLHAFAARAAPDAWALRTWRAVLSDLVSLTWVLRLIRAEDGSASLAAFQVLLWSLVVAGSATYVMSLSGELIDITQGTLVLLGIAGGAGLVSAFQQPAPAASGETVPREPRWTDLVTAAGSATPDVTRVQMLLFTVLTAGFVAMKVLTTYVIPDIPSGYQLLMGLSNSVYVGAKFAARKPPPDAAAAPVAPAPTPAE
jgi:hypothetical protein